MVDLFRGEGSADDVAQARAQISVPPHLLRQPFFGLRRMTYQTIGIVVSFTIFSLWIQAACASECIISGKRYALDSDAVDWSLKIQSGQICIRGLRFSDVLIDIVKV